MHKQIGVAIDQLGNLALRETVLAIRSPVLAGNGEGASGQEDGAEERCELHCGSRWWYCWFLTEETARFADRFVLLRGCYDATRCWRGQAIFEASETVAWWLAVTIKGSPVYIRESRCQQASVAFLGAQW
jgi:hypothetical protein